MMNISDCIKSLDLSNGITQEQLQKHSCLSVAIPTRSLLMGISPDLKEDIEDFKIIDTDELIVILFKAVQELKAEIDALKTL